MPVRFAGQELKPAPLVTIEKTYVKDEGGHKINTNYNFSLKGTIVNIAGGGLIDSPGVSSITMDGILAGQKLIRDTFSSEGGRLEIESPNGGGPNTLDAFCIVNSVSFGEGTWVNRCEYTVSLTTNSILSENDINTNLQSIGENWSITENEDTTYSVSHSLNAVGALIYNVSGLVPTQIDAKNWCRDRSYTLSSGVMTVHGGSGVSSFAFNNLINNSAFTGNNFWNMSHTEGVGQINRSWQLTEAFLYNPSGSVREEFSATVNYDDNNLRRLNITANGSIYGYSTTARDWPTKLNNAKTYYLANIEPNTYLRASSYKPSGFSVNPMPKTKQVSYEEIPGVVRYSLTYTAYSGSLIANAAEENVSVVDTAPTDIFAQIPIPGRAQGPVVQNMFTKTLPERTVSITATLQADNTNLSTSNIRSMWLAKPNTDAIVNALIPLNGYYYIKQNTEEFNPIRRNYSRTVSWTIQPENFTIIGEPNSVSNQAPV